MKLNKLILSTLTVFIMVFSVSIDSFATTYTTTVPGDWFTSSTWANGNQPNNNPTNPSIIISNNNTTLSNASGSTLQFNNGSNYIINAPIIDLSTSSGWSLTLDNSGGNQAAINADVYFKGGFTINNPCTIAGNAYFGGTLNVSNSGSSSLRIKSGYSVTVGGLSVANSLIIEPGATLIVLGNVTVTNDGSATIKLDGKLIATGTVNVKNAITGTGTLVASPIVVSNDGSAGVFGQGNNSTITCPGTCTLSDPSQNPTCSGVSAAISANQTICTGATPALFNSTIIGGGIQSFQWQVYNGTAFSNAFLAVGSTYTPSALISGTSYRLKVSILLSCTAVYSNVIVVNVNNTTPLGVGAVGGSSLACRNSSNVAYNVSGLSNVSSYNWTVPSGFTIAAGGTTSTITVSIGAGASNGVISVMGVNGCGQSASYSFPVTVTSLPSGTGIISSQSNSICNNQNGLGFTVTGYSNTTGFNWTVPSGMVISSGQGTNIISVNTTSVSGTVVVSVAGVNGCGTGTVAGQSLTMDNYKWIGTSTDWAKATNWCGGSIPGISSDIIMPSGISIYPIVTVNSGFQNITISGGASLSVLSNYNVSVSGNWLNNGTFSGSASTVLFNGSTTQTISGTSNSNFYNLSASNTQGVVLASNQSVKGTLTLGASTTLNSAGNLILYSDVSGTGRLATLPAGATVTGNVMVQNYMGSKVNSRYLTFPVQNVPISQLQTSIWVTGQGTGFDVPSYIPTIFTYVESVTGSVSYGKTKATSATQTFVKGLGYEILIRSRASALATATQSYKSTAPVTLSVTGALNQGNASLPVTYTNTGNATADGWNLVGNPYPSQIDWDAVGGVWTKTNIASSIYFLDPNSSLTSSTTLPGQAYTYIPGTGCVPAVAGCNSLIAEGQGFYVRATGLSPVLSATEAVKSAGTSRRNFREDLSAVADLIRVSVKGTNGLLDETIVRLGDGFTDGFDGDDNDVLKFSNSNLNLSTKSAEGYSLVMNSTAFDSVQKVIPLLFSSTLSDTYTVEVNTESVYSASTAVYIRENTTMTETKVTGIADLSFIYNLGDTTAKNRYSLVLRKIIVIDTVIVNQPVSVTGVGSISDSLNTIAVSSGTGIVGSNADSLISSTMTSITGTYIIKTAVNSIADTTQQITKILSESDLEKGINIYPDPLMGSNLTLTVENGLKIINIEIYNNLYTKVYAINVTKEDNLNNLILSNLDFDSGIYFIKINLSEGKIVTKKLAKL